jgi:HlyD family secretion protein
MKHSTKLACAAAVLVFLGACKKDEAAPLYEPVAVERRDIVVSAEAAGTVEPILVVDVKSKASGEILELRGETGDIVSQGDLLVRVDPRDPNNSVAQAEADLDVARAQLTNAEAQKRRADQMFAAQLVSEQEHENTNLQYANARASSVRAERALQTARDQLDDTNVRAPITGTIIQKSVERGQVIASATREVSGGTVLLRMADLGEVQVRTLVDETDIGKIQAGMRATITVDAYPNRPFEGTVLKIEPQSSVSQNVTMFPVLIRIPNEQGFLRPGMNASVEIHVANRSNVLAIPNSALRTQRDVESAAQVLGIDPKDVEATLARQDSVDRQNPATARGQQSGGGQAGGGTPGRAGGGVAAVPPQAGGGMRMGDAQSPARGEVATGSSARQPAALPAAGPPDAGTPPGAGMQAGGTGAQGGPGAGARMNVPLPEGVTEEMRAEIRRKRQAGEALTPAESTASVRMREAFQRMREQQGGGMPGAQGVAATGAPAGQGGAPGQAPGVTGNAPTAGAPAAGGDAGEASGMRLPPGVTEAQARDILRRRFSGGTLTAQEQAIASRVMQGFQQQAGNGGAQRRRFGSGSSFQFGGSYIVFVLENGKPTPKRIRTGYTDMDYSEVVSGLTEQDTVLLLPSASLVNQQTQMRNRMSQMGGGVPGMTKAPTGGPGGGRPGGDH